MRTEVFVDVFEELLWSWACSIQWAWQERREWNTSLTQAGRCTAVGAFRESWTSTSYFLEHCHLFYSRDSCISHGNPFEVGVGVLVLEVCKQKPVESHIFSKWQRHSKPGFFESSDALGGPTLCYSTVVLFFAQ